MTPQQMQTEIEKLQSEVKELNLQLLSLRQADLNIVSLIERNAKTTNELIQVVQQIHKHANYEQ